MVDKSLIKKVCQVGVTGMILCLLTIFSESAHADWSFNLGYQNPPSATAGVNFLYRGSSWAFETGIGYIDVDANADEDNEDSPDEDEDDDGAAVRISGDLDVKYFFAGKSIAPYAQVGIGAGLGAAVGDENGVGAGAGGLYGGLGLMAGKSFYGYASVNVDGGLNGVFLQAGLGFDI